MLNGLFLYVFSPISDNVKTLVVFSTINVGVTLFDAKLVPNIVKPLTTLFEFIPFMLTELFSLTATVNGLVV